MCFGCYNLYTVADVVALETNHQWWNDTQIRHVLFCIRGYSMDDAVQFEAVRVAKVHIEWLKTNAGATTSKKLKSAVCRAEAFYRRHGQLTREEIRAVATSANIEII